MIHFPKHLSTISQFTSTARHMDPIVSQTGFSGFIKNYRVYYSILFIGFGILITLITALVTYRIRIVDIESELERSAEVELNRKQEELTGYLSGLTDYIEAVRTSNILHTYILQPTKRNRSDANNLFYVLAKTNNSIMQLRYLNTNGQEHIRVDQGFGMTDPVIVKQDNLQDKSHRYYFIETSQLPPNSFWFSNLDLNIENNKIEVPHNPVIRVAAPVYIDRQFHGIVILNIHAKEFLNHFIDSRLFNISLLDRDGYYIIHRNASYSWSRYLQSGHGLARDYPERAHTILAGVIQSRPQKYGDIFAASVASQLPKDGAVILFEPKRDQLVSLERERRKAAIIIVVFIFLLSLPLAYLIARAPARLSQKIMEQNTTLREYFELIDTNIPSCTVKNDGTLVDPSRSFAEKLGYSREELQGIDHTALFDEDVTDETSRIIFATVTADKTWKGELHFTTRSGKDFYSEATAYPKRDDDGTITAYSVIHKDITNQKKIEKISITDDLTGLYNRRFFNETIVSELNRALRDRKILSFAMMDIDFFKQYNDLYGHQKGDEVLQAVSHALKTKLSRASDFSFRLGGEEFGLLFTNLQEQEAHQFVDAVRHAIKEIGIRHDGSKVADTVTVSIGLLSVMPGATITIDAIYKKADEALYEAKNSGRNRVVHKFVT